MKRLIYSINKLFRKKRKIILNEFIYEMTKSSIERKKNSYNRYNQLFNDYKKKEKIINELKYKFNKSEEKLYTFSPKINSFIMNKQKSIKKDKNKSFDSKIKNPLFGIGRRTNNNYSYDMKHINDLIKYETIQYDTNNNIIMDFLNTTRINNGTNNILYYKKTYNNFNDNPHSINTIRYDDSKKSKTIEIKENNNKNKLFYQLSSIKKSKKSKGYHLDLIKKENENKNKINYETIDYTEPIGKNYLENNSNLKKNKNIINRKRIFNEILSGKNINSELKMNNITNEESKVNDYYYSFREGKIPYNSFNNSFKKNSIHLNSKISKFNNKKKTKIPISLRNNSKIDNYYTIKRMNKIYSNNYNNKIFIKKKSEQDININNNNSFNQNYKNKISFLTLTSKKESTRQQSITNLNSNNNTGGYNVSSFSLNPTIIIQTNKENNSTNKKSTKEFTYYCPSSDNKNNKCKNNKSEKSMTLQSLSDSKMLELAEYYINKEEESFEDNDLKYLELKRNMKKEKECRNITFG